ncbi:hypothetical protein Moror_11111 [Moniliophthora roreri MCA 2997]|uniref:Uncharacterized protein n=2 Tax=Moniliophthora roreri TaxID=221103 RepID=V2WN58_MONRO|nr:hypothetical protein Moror_11111 [Moniliophthora roreri MCA 2997]
MLIGILHGHAHQHLCQLMFLLVYVIGAGMENLEQCEWYFSKSNVLGGVTRYMSKFHRRQAIVHYAAHTDEYETYANLSKFIYTNYQLALNTLAGLGKVMEALQALGITNIEICSQWLKDERRFLEEQKDLPQPMMAEREYLSKLKALMDCQTSLAAGMDYSADDVIDALAVKRDKSNTLAAEKAVFNLAELKWKLLRDIQTLETKLEIGKGERWTLGCLKWLEVEKMVRDDEWVQVLHKLEDLVVTRIFEMARLNSSGNCYKMRAHLSKALTSRSSAIEAALKALNDMAKASGQEQLQWKDVMEYTFLSEFDILKHTGDNMCSKLWAKPAYWEVMLKVFKMYHAEEEIQRLHVEIKRLMTYIKEEDAYLRLREAQVGEDNLLLAHQICLHRQIHGSPEDKVHFVPGIGVQSQLHHDCDINILNNARINWEGLTPVQQQQTLLNLAHNNISNGLNGIGLARDEEVGESKGEEEAAEAEEALECVLGQALLD